MIDESVNHNSQFERLINHKKKSIYLSKNPASIAFIRINQLTYLFMMRENGGKIMKLQAKKFKLADIRQQSLFKKDMNQKWIIFR